ncbi:MAG TPA: pirin family protein [Alphaproteobacteria bacterium]|nr:pirin family protein [Alphaproteobacteria bacterium]
MSIIVRKSNERGHLNHGWLNTYHTFSFGEYYDLKHMGYRTLRVINEDIVQGGYGFDMHPHKNMEIITYVIDGCLKHEDNMGNHAEIGPGNVQIMSAGSGVLHSETNPTRKNVHLIQIWIIPNILNIKPRHEEAKFDRSQKLNKLCLIASHDENNYRINQDAKVFASILEKGNKIKYNIQKGRGLWIQLISGSVTLNDEIKLEKGDGASIEAMNNVVIESHDDNSEFLLFDLA